MSEAEVAAARHAASIDAREELAGICRTMAQMEQAALHDRARVADMERKQRAKNEELERRVNALEQSRFGLAMDRDDSPRADFGLRGDQHHHA